MSPLPSVSSATPVVPPLPSVSSATPVVPPFPSVPSATPVVPPFPSVPSATPVVPPFPSVSPATPVVVPPPLLPVVSPVEPPCVPSSEIVELELELSHAANALDRTNIAIKVLGVFIVFSIVPMSNFGVNSNASIFAVTAEMLYYGSIIVSPNTFLPRYVCILAIKLFFGNKAAFKDVKYDSFGHRNAAIVRSEATCWSVAVRHRDAKCDEQGYNHRPL